MKMRKLIVCLAVTMLCLLCVNAGVRLSARPA